MWRRFVRSGKEESYLYECVKEHAPVDWRVQSSLAVYNCFCIIALQRAPHDSWPAALWLQYSLLIGRLAAITVMSQWPLVWRVYREMILQGLVLYGSFADGWAFDCWRTVVWGYLQQPGLPDSLRLTLALFFATNCWTLVIYILGFPMRILWGMVATHSAVYVYYAAIVACFYDSSLDSSPLLQAARRLLDGCGVALGTHQTFILLALILQILVFWSAFCARIVSDGKRRLLLKGPFALTGISPPWYFATFLFTPMATWQLGIGISHVQAESYRLCTDWVWHCPI